MPIKNTLHTKNRFKHSYDLKSLVNAQPSLQKHIIKTTVGKDSVDFSSPEAVRLLNQALLKSQYNIHYWQVPSKNLCPGIPGRLDYLCYLNELLTEDHVSSHSSKIKALDIGTGASCIYPLLGVKEFNWRFVGSDIDPNSLANSQKIVEENQLEQQIELRLQAESGAIFQHIIKADEYFAVTLCNPPFHRSLAEASQGTQRKWQNLNNTKQAGNVQKQRQSEQAARNNSALNFGGQHAELWCDGGEVKFIRNMIKESRFYAQQVLWFTSLVSKKDSLSAIKLSAKKQPIKQFKVIKMMQGNKTSRFIAWSFMTLEEQKSWCAKHLK